MKLPAEPVDDKTIKDSVHDYIPLTGVALRLLDTGPVQRLRHVKQLGTVHLVYPSANHTRFEHSLGVYHLAGRAMEELGVEGRDAERVRAAALLHDVGHAPYSHNLEPVLERHSTGSHEDIRERLRDDELAELERVVESAGLDFDRVAALLVGEGRFGDIVSGELDVDRMDYLVRDAHHTGVPYGTIDHDRLVRQLAFHDDRLVLAEGNIQTAENLLIARALMNATVYNHHVSRISKRMLHRATERLLDAGAVTAAELWRMDDHDLHAALRGHETTAGVAERLARRDLFKRAVWAEHDDVTEAVRDADPEEIRDLEADIAADAGVDPESVLLDVPPLSPMPESSTRVLVGGEARRLGEHSALVEALRRVQRQQWRFGVFTPADQVGAVGRAAERVLGLDTDGDLVRERRGRVVPLSEFGDDGS